VKFGFKICISFSREMPEWKSKQLSKRATWRDFGFLNGKSELLTGAEPETCNRLSTQRRKGAKE
jgi:hypothetical protein